MLTSIKKMFMTVWNAMGNGLKKKNYYIQMCFRYFLFAMIVLVIILMLPFLAVIAIGVFFLLLIGIVGYYCGVFPKVGQFINILLDN